MGFFQQNRTPGENDGFSVEQEYKRAKNSGWRDVILCALIIVLVVLAKDTFFSSAELTPVLGETEFGIVTPDGETHSFVYAELEAIEFREGLKDFDRGEPLEGEEARRCWSGIYQNSEFGKYQLYAMSKLDSYIVVHTPDGVIVFNMESDETTKTLYNFFVEQSGLKPAA